MPGPRAQLRALAGDVGETFAVTTRGGRVRWERVLAARRQAGQALGRGPDTSDPFSGPPKRRAPQTSLPAPKSAAPLHPSERSEIVLTLGQAAARLGVSRPELEAMIAAGKIEALPTGFTRAIPIREVERLKC
jgi:excisionase family DNA binding protein